MTERRTGDVILVQVGNKFILCAVLQQGNYTDANGKSAAKPGLINSILVRCLWVSLLTVRKLWEVLLVPAVNLLLQEIDFSARVMLRTFVFVAILKMISWVTGIDLSKETGILAVLLAIAQAVKG